METKTKILGNAATYKFILPGAMLERGFWLYVWRVESPKGEYLYVGRTGDNSSPFATPPYTRMGQHLGHQKNQNALRKYLVHNDVEPEKCTLFELITYGPIFSQQADMTSHKVPRDLVAALEKALAENLSHGGYRVMNIVRCKQPVRADLLAAVEDAFSIHFPKMKKTAGADVEAPTGP